MKAIIRNQSEVTINNYGAIDFQEFLSVQESENMSVAIINLHGTNKKIKNKIADSFYFVLEGEGTFTIEGKEHTVKKHDLIVIPKNTVYFDSGNMTMLSFSNPRFDKNRVEYVD